MNKSIEEDQMKISRQAKIVELIGRYQIETQEELCELLNKEGYEVTQATVSRDIRALKLTKVVAPNGKQCYKFIADTQELSQKQINILRDGFVSCDMAQNLLVVRTAVGLAQAVAASIDALRFDEVMGCIAGDDTILIVTRTMDDCLEVMKKLRKIVEEGRDAGRT